MVRTKVNSNEEKNHPMHIYLQGLTMGLAYVAPIGLQNLFVINSALTQRRSRVYLTALIVIFWDISLGVSCFLGAGALMQAVPWLQKVILAAGSLIVIWIGIGLLRSKASLEGGKDVNVPVWKLITSAFVVTWLNPQAIIDGTMMLGAFRATLPAARMTFWSQGTACISAPAPRKQETPREMSQKMTISAVRYTRLRLWVRALLMTNRFCRPMGAT